MSDANVGILITACATLVGAAIGAFAGPLSTAWLSKRAEKKRIKSDLFENIYLLFNYLKAHSVVANRKGVLSTYAKLIYDEINRGNQERRAALHAKAKEVEERINNVETGDWFEKMSVVEAKLQRLVAESRDYFDKETSRNLRKLIRDILVYTNSQEAVYIFDYFNITMKDIETWVDAEHSIRQGQREQEYQSICERHLTTLQEILTNS